jgi:hypothetical protein
LFCFLYKRAKSACLNHWQALTGMSSSGDSRCILMATFWGKVALPLDLPHMNTIPVQAPSLLIHVCGA